MPTITDWLMVAITAVYVIATIFICRANIKSAEATREQVAESKRQFEETRRLGIMPYLQAETFDGLIDHKLELILKDDDISGGDYILHIRIKNMGNGTAKDIRYKWNNFAQCHDNGLFPIRGLKSGDGKSISISFTRPGIIADYTMASLDLTYEDLLENSYMQRLIFCLEKGKTGLTLKSYAMCPPCVLDKKNTYV